MFIQCMSMSNNTLLNNDGKPDFVINCCSMHRLIYWYSILVFLLSVLTISDISLRSIYSFFALLHSYLHAVLDFGANGDGTTDNVKPFQNSLNAASAGGIGNPSLYRSSIIALSYYIMWIDYCSVCTTRAVCI